MAKAPKNLDLAGFKKVEGTRNYSVFQDEHGNMLRLMHDSVDKEKAQDMRKLPFQKFNKGGKVKPKKNLKIDAEKAKKFREGFKGALGLYRGTEKPLVQGEFSRVDPRLPQVDPELPLAARGGELPLADTAWQEGLAPGEVRSSTRDMTPEELAEMERKRRAGTLDIIEPGAEQPGLLDLARNSEGLPERQPAEQLSFTEVDPQTGQMQQSDDPYSQSIKSIREGTRAQMEAQQEIAKSMANIEGQRQQAVQQAEKDLAILQQSEQDVRQQFGEMRKQLVDLQKQEVDPSRIYGEMGTGQKIANVIGLIAGGLGAGAAGGRNLAVEALDRLVEQDVAAQKANMAQQNNLLKYNMELLGDEQKAISLRRAQHFEMLNLKLQDLASQAKNPNVAAQMKALAGEYQVKAEQEVAPLMKEQARELAAQRKAQLAAQEDAQRTLAGAAQDRETGQKLLTKVDEALNILDKTDLATGWAGRIGANINPESEGAKLQSRIKTIQANLGFDTLQKMRERSKTGGALGQVSEREIDLLQAAVQNLDTFQAEEDLAANLKNIKVHYDNVLKNLDKIERQAASTLGGGTGTQAAPQTKTIMVEGKPVTVKKTARGWEEVL